MFLIGWLVSIPEFRDLNGLIINNFIIKKNMLAPSPKAKWRQSPEVGSITDLWWSSVLRTSEFTKMYYEYDFYRKTLSTFANIL
jgi:hypothetical protein